MVHTLSHAQLSLHLRVCTAEVWVRLLAHACEATHDLAYSQLQGYGQNTDWTDIRQAWASYMWQVQTFSMDHIATSKVL